MVVLPDGAYCGIAPVPGGRVNIGIVLSRGGPGAATAGGRRRGGDHGRSARTDPVAPRRPGGVAHGARRPTPSPGASPLGSRVARRAGPGWLVVGDAAGFLDPFTGEGLHRALVSARLAAGAIDAHLRGSTGRGDEASTPTSARCAGRFASKDLVSRLVLSFLARPPLFERAARHLARAR